jgi:hypothetical protein
MPRFAILLGFLVVLSFSNSFGQDKKIIPDTVYIAGDTLLMLGDSIIMREPKKEKFWKTGGN